MNHADIDRADQAGFDAYASGERKSSREDDGTMITDYKAKILAVLDENGGFTTGQVSRKVSLRVGCNQRQHSAAVRSWLLQLQADGLVREMDDQKPTCWVKNK